MAVTPSSSWLQLLSHPTDPPSFQAFHLESNVQFVSTPDLIKLSFRVTGPVSELSWPKESLPSLAPVQGQKLWEHTCFELFIANTQNENYCEWNFNSARQWDHFQFSSYRNPSSSPKVPAGIQKVDFKREVNSALLTVEINIEEIDCLKKILINKEALFLATTAVLENKKGEKSHWALSHQDAHPDFHNRNSFIAKIPA